MLPPNKSQIVRNIVGPKGPVTAGLVKAQELNAKLFPLIDEKMKKGFIYQEEFENIVSKFVPKNVKVEFHSLLSTYVGRGKRYGGYVRKEPDGGLLIVIRNDNPKWRDGSGTQYKKKSMFIIMHETFHLFRHLTTPKFQARVKSIKYADYEFYQDTIYKKVSTLKKLFNWQDKLTKKIDQYLDTIPKDKQIDVLQYFRYRTIDEALAINESVKYSNKKNLNKKFAYKEKYEIIERLLIEKMKELRGKATLS